MTWIPLTDTKSVMLFSLGADLVTDRTHLYSCLGVEIERTKINVAGLSNVRF